MNYTDPDGSPEQQAKPQLLQPDKAEDLILSGLFYLGSGLIDQSQKMTAAAMQMADMKVCAHLS
jgi:hypothetical protein